eukprot:CAMPEP_0116898316 /NCGR_PEP_ID=MMETSP0467-20121206/7053_1 /TAXON_ID=283647 /ORGANISM="Mesodinium pulex, Strain SPMC105" /LENGTH=54 /DNA_ID=CAMNT_0004570351 /DNA_START=319 /DNA_END=483 /DNA_ORIENTATION=+
MYAESKAEASQGNNKAFNQIQKAKAKVNAKLNGIENKKKKVKVHQDYHYEKSKK